MFENNILKDSESITIHLGELGTVPLPSNTLGDLYHVSGLNTSLCFEGNVKVKSRAPKPFFFVSHSNERLAIFRVKFRTVSSSLNFNN